MSVFRVSGFWVALILSWLACFSVESQADDSQGANLLKSDLDTSTPAIAPPWSLEPWFWEDDVNNAETVWDLVHGCESHDLPIGGVLLDSPWATAYNNFRFDEHRYPDPKGMIEQLHRRGIRVVLWMTNIVNTSQDREDAAGDPEDLYALGKSRGYFVNGGLPVRWWKGRGGLVDYTNPEAVAWWHRLMDRALSLGADGWKLDGAAELFVMTLRQTSRGTLSLRDYMDLYYRDSLDYGRRYKADFVTMVRSVDIANSQGLDFPHAPFDAAPLTWVGDQRHAWTDKGIDEAARSFFRALERGYPVVSSDTGGYQDDPKNPDTMPRLLYLRWAQWNAWTPFFLIGGHNEHRPWKFDPEFLAIFRRYLWLHRELVPFFYSQHVQASLREGRLLHRGPGQREFLLGDTFLVGAMDNERPSMEITFPDGTWLDYWENRREFSGGQKIQVDVPETRNPVFVRLGAIVPLEVRNDAAGHGTTASAGWHTLDCYPSNAESRAVVWDTGHFPPEVNRDRTLVTMSPSDKGLALRIEGGPKQDTILRIRHPKRPDSVRRDGQSLPQSLQRSDWEKPADGWWYDEPDQRLWIRLAGASDSAVEVSDASNSE